MTSGRPVGPRRRRAVASAPALVLALVLALAACGDAVEGAADGADGAGGAGATAAADATPVPAPGPAPAPESGRGPGAAPHPFDATNPDLGWPFASDVELVLGLAERMNAAFAAGNEAGFTFMAEHSWPDGFTADALLACRLAEPSPTWAELDEIGHGYRFTIAGALPAPYFVYPPTGEYPFDAGLRVYVVMYRAETVVGGEVVNVFDDPSRVAIRPDGTPVMFPTCFDHLPGGMLAHRVTDGNVGGYTDAEAAGDVRVLMENSPPAARAEVCALLAAGDLATIAEMVVPPDVFDAGLRIPRAVLQATLPALCADPGT